MFSFALVKQCFIFNASANSDISFLLTGILSSFSKSNLFPIRQITTS